MLPEEIKNVHFIGIGGYGMSALAFILLKKGYTVTGSDLKESPLSLSLSTGGATVIIGHAAENLGAADLVVYSTAIAAENPELAETNRRALPLWHRSELLAALLNSAYGIAIAGAHGKTTTTAMVALLLEAAGLDPTAVIGGILPAYAGNARLGSGRYLVAEADESDQSFTRYYPQLALVTGIEADHLEHYNNDYAVLKNAYQTFLSHLPADGAAVLCYDDHSLRDMARSLNCPVIAYGYSFASGADYYAENVTLSGGAAAFDLYHCGKLLAPAVKLGVPGRHNVSNAVGALAIADRLKAALPAAALALQQFKGVGRRYDIVGAVNAITVIDDYAHHPTEIKATLEAARYAGQRIICIFQPHRYSRTACFFDQFARAFGDADYLFVHSIYAAGEAPIAGITPEELARQVKLYSHIPAEYNSDISILEEKAAAIARPGDMIITMGAGDITNSARRIVKLLQEKVNR